MANCDVHTREWRDRYVVHHPFMAAEPPASPMVSHEDRAVSNESRPPVSIEYFVTRIQQAGSISSFPLLFLRGSDTPRVYSPFFRFRRTFAATRRRWSMGSTRTIDKTRILGRDRSKQGWSFIDDASSASEAALELIILEN